MNIARPWDCESFPKSKTICYGGGGGGGGGVQLKPTVPKVDLHEVYQGSTIDQGLEDIQDFVLNPKPSGTSSSSGGNVNVIDSSGPIIPAVLDALDPEGEPDWNPPPDNTEDPRMKSGFSEEEFGNPSLDTQAEFTRRKLVKRPTLSPRKGLALNPKHAGSTGLNIGYKRE
jgi:hypothetical protein